MSTNNEKKFVKKDPQKKIERNQQIEPSSSFSRNQIFTTTSEEKPQSKIEKKTGKKLLQLDFHSEIKID